MIAEIRWISFSVMGGYFFLLYFFTFKGTKQRELRSVFMEKGLYFSGNVNT